MKIGILTHYFKSQNYGGNLQAYALVHFLRLNGYDAEQISYNFTSNKKRKQTIIKRFVCKIKAIPRFVNRNINNILFKKRILIVNKKLKERRLCIDKFNSNIIVHSLDIYDYYNISEANVRYDAFITGSDQVWHPNKFCPAFLLSFVKKRKKISYAASIAQKNISKEDLDYLSSNVRDYTSISVRELDSAILLTSKINRSVFCAIDPIFLLSQEMWSNVMQPYLIEGPYLLTYFLGNNENARLSAQMYANYKKIKLISLPYLNGSYRACDWTFGEKQIFDAGPEHFLSLVKNASFIFTDSFHATAFSILFEKKFIVFSYDSKNEQINRIDSLLEISGCLERFNSPNTLFNAKKIDNILYRSKINYQNIEKEIEKSKSFLLSSLK